MSKEPERTVRAVLAGATRGTIYTSLRAKTLAFIAATIALLMGVLFVPLRTILLGSFLALEDQTTRQNVERALNGLHEEIGRLSQTAQDYAAWDDTYFYMEGKGYTFPEVNFVDSTFVQNKLNLVMLISNEGKVLWSRAFDLGVRRAAAVPLSLQPETFAFPSLLRKAERSGTSGLLLLPEGTWMIATEPVLTSAWKGPVAGTMIMGRILDDEAVARLAEKTKLALSLHPLADASLSPELRAAQARLTTSTPILAEPLGEHVIAGYGLVEDILWRAGLILRISVPRDIYEEGKRGVFYLAMALLIAGLAFGVLIMFILERLVLARLARLSRGVISIGKSGDLSMRLGMDGSDELTATAQEVDHMLASLERLNRLLETERAKSERLLLNVLPGSVAERLKVEGTAIIADSFPEVTVLFADLVGFTSFSAHTSPPQLVEMLNEIFSAFDALAERHGLEKIKTIGDAYMVVAGLPLPREDHAEAIAAMALDMLEEIKRFSRAHESDLNIRVGINTGPVVAGVIGTKKFIYDIWGDAVNIASRMESSGLPGRIQISEATYLKLRGKFVCEERGLVQVKGKGEMKTYLVLARADDATVVERRASEG